MKRTISKTAAVFNFISIHHFPLCLSNGINAKKDWSRFHILFCRTGSVQNLCCHPFGFLLLIFYQKSSFFFSNENLILTLGIFFFLVIRNLIFHIRSLQMLTRDDLKATLSILRNCFSKSWYFFSSKLGNLFRRL